MSRALTLLAGRYAICRLRPDDQVPSWALGVTADFISVTRTRTELSVICAADSVPPELRRSGDAAGWRCLRVEGPFGLDEPGVLVSVAAPVSAAGLSVFAVATYDTDYLLVTELGPAIAALRLAGHRIKSGA